MDIKEQLKSNYTKVNRKRYLLYTDKYVTYPYINEFGEEVNSTKHGQVCFCPCCSKMSYAGELYSFINKEDIPKSWTVEESFMPGSYKCDRISGSLERKDGKIKLVCPHCKEDITNYDKWLLKCGSDYVFDNWVFDAYSYFVDEANNKISFTLFFITLFPNTKASKLAVTNYNFKIVFNTKTGQTYVMEVRETNGKKKRPKWFGGARLRNVTYSGYNCCNNIISNCLRNGEILKKMTNVLIGYYKGDINNLLLPGMTVDDLFTEDKVSWWSNREEHKQIDFGILTAYNRFNKLGLNRAFYNYLRVIENDSRSYNKRNEWRKIRNLLLLLINSEDTPSAFGSLIEKYNIPNKKKIKKIIFSNPLSVFSYNTIINFGFSDYNVIMDIMENHANSIKYLSDYCNSDDLKKIAEFITALIALRGEPNTKKIIFSSDAQEIKGYLTDTARMYCKIKEEDTVDNQSMRGTVREMHDKLSSDYRKIRQKNRTITYSEEELKLNHEINGYEFTVARDTHQLIDVGENMGICVGSYGDRAYNKLLIIVTMTQKGKYVGCIELSADGKTLKQAKAKYNNRLQEYKAEALKEWVELMEIDGSHCYDYEHIINDAICYDEDKIYQGTHNYADYGMPFWD